MGIGETLNRIERRYALTFVGFLLAIIFGGITIYTEFFRDNSPQIEFDIVGNASVLDVRENLSGLRIIYDDIDIQRASMSLRVMLVRMTNSGGSGIEIGSFDPDAPVGLEFPDSKILKVDVISASSAYLSEHVAFNIAGESHVRLSPIILDRGEHVVIKCLLLHGASFVPVVHAAGKVAGVRDIVVVDSSQSDVRPTIAREAFGGALGIQILRFFGYLAAGLVALVLAATLLAVSSSVAQQRRRRQVSRFIDQNPQLSQRLVPIGRVYYRHGITALRAAIGFVQLMTDPLDGGKSSSAAQTKMQRYADAAASLRAKLRSHAIRVGVLVERDGVAVLDHEQIHALRAFLTFLESDG